MRTNTILGLLAGSMVATGVAMYVITPNHNPPDLTEFIQPQPPRYEEEFDLEKYNRRANESALKKPTVEGNQPRPDLVCATFDATGLLSDKCEYSGWNRTITINANMSASEARKCETYINVLRGFHLQGWTLRIGTPYTGDKSIAICDLEN